MAGDVVALEGTDCPGEALLQPMMRGGQLVAPYPRLIEAREHAARLIARLPVPLRRLEPYLYPVEIDPGLHRLAASLSTA